tara:strand:- start:86439 stop:86789 length:351 start_codon:yes stop_codon:yes gene_type:complete
MLKTIPELIQDIRPGLRCVSAETARAELNNSGGVLIDVREAAEVSQQPVSKAVPIPRGVLEMKVSEQFPDAEHPIYVHCASGARATLAGEQLHRIGYQRISVITCPLDKVVDSHGE